jgi:hypothetical protein
VNDYDTADVNDDGVLSEEELMAQTVASLKHIASEEGWVLTSTKKSDIVAEMLVHQALVPTPKAGTATIFEAAVSSLQENIAIADGAITGTSKYKTGYTGFSGDAELQSGYFLALDITAPDGATKTTVELVGGVKGPVELDADMDVAFRITSNSQKIKIVTTVDGRDYENLYALTGLTLANA